MASENLHGPDERRRVVQSVSARVAAAILTLLLAACQNAPQRNASDPVVDDTAVDIKVIRERAQQSYTAGDWAAAETHYVALVREIPQEADHWFKLGNIYARTDRPDLAVASYREALVREPELAKAWFNMGIVQLRQAANSFHKMEVHVTGDDPTRRQAADAYAAILEILDDDGKGQVAGPAVAPVPAVPKASAPAAVPAVVPEDG